MSEHVYDFSVLDKKKSKKLEKAETHPNFRITPCCGNCIYFKKFSSQPRYKRGFCEINSSAEVTKLGKQNVGRRRYDWEYIKNNWFKAHATTLCDKHSYRKKGHCVYPVELYMGFTFDKKTFIAKETV